MMDYLIKTCLRLRDDTRGATMVEYTILVGLITVAVIGAVTAIGPWIGTQWTTLQTTLGL